MMQSLIPLCSVLISGGLAHPVQDFNWVDLGEITVFGHTDPDGKMLPARKVPIRFPEQFLPLVSEESPYLEHGDWKIVINQWGNLGRAYKNSGGLTEFKELWENAQKRISEGKSNTWKCKAVVFRRTDVLYQDEDGVLIPQRAYISDRELDFCLQTFARFKALVEAFTEGAVELQLTVSVEEEPIRGFYKNDEVWTLNPWTAGSDYLEGRFNYGDFDCLIYMFHPGETRSFSFGGAGGRTNNTTQAYVILTNGREGGARIGHTEAMLHEWFHQVEDTYFRYGYGGYEYSGLPYLHSAEQNGYNTDEMGYSGWFTWIRDLMRKSVNQKMWAALSNRKDPDFEEAIERTKRFDGSTRKWDTVKDNTWGNLPFLTVADLATIAGVNDIEIITDKSCVLFLPNQLNDSMRKEISDDDYVLDNQLNFAKESMAILRGSEKSVLFVRWDVADFVIPKLRNDDGSSVNVYGTITIDGRAMYVVELRTKNPTTSEINLLMLGRESNLIGLQDKGDYLLGENAKFSFSSNLSDARFALTSWDGDVLEITSDGTYKIEAGSPKVHIWKLVMALPDGTRYERPIIVRTHHSVNANLEAVGTSRISNDAHRFQLTLQNNVQQQNVRLTASLPSGWTVSELPESVSLNSKEKRTITFQINTSPTTQDGVYSVAIDVKPQNNNTITIRKSVTRYTQAGLVYDAFESDVGNWRAIREDNGGWKVELHDEGVQGKCLAIHDSGGIRWGRVNAFGGYDANGKPDLNFMGYDVSVFPYLDFYLKTEFNNNLGLVVTTHEGKRYTIMLAGKYAEQWGESVQLSRARFIPNGEWQRIVYNLHEELAKKAGAGPHYIVDISFGDTRKFSSNQYRDPYVNTHYIDEFKITANANLNDNTTPAIPNESVLFGKSFNSAVPMERARACVLVDAQSSPEEIEKVIPLINDSSSIVRLNAVNVFTRVHYSGVVPKLIDRARVDPDVTVSVFAVRAIEFQNTDEGWEAIAQLPRLNRFGEEPLAEAGLAMGRTRNSKYRADISILIATKYWQTRRAAATALGMLGDESSQNTLMAFLHEIDPMVRLEATKHANVNHALPARRIEWGSVNDISSVVRGFSYARLILADDPVLRSRGYAGLNSEDNDPIIRKIICEAMGNDAKAHHLPILKGMLRDPIPDVRASAVEAIFKIPGQKTFEDISVLANEKYEQVLLPVFRNAKEGKIVIPSNMIERALAHRNAELRKIAGELKR